MKKKLFSILLIAVMVLSSFSAVFADAADTTITVPANDGHTYEVYQIYVGELANGKLSNVKYGADAAKGTEGALVPESELEAVAAISGTDAEKAAELAKYANINGSPKYTVESGKSITVPTGYYLIKDLTGATLDKGDEATLYIAQVVGPTTISRKAGNTSSDKTVDDVNDSNTTDTNNNFDKKKSSDYDIGDNVPYHLSATITEKAGQYKKYKLIFQDVLEAGCFSAIQLSADNIKIDGVKLADTADYTVSITGVDNATKDGFTVNVVFTPKEGKTLDSIANKTVTIDFSATLGDGAKIGSAGNHNTFTLKYSNNPNDDEGGEPVEDTPKTVVTFTYKVVVNKVDQDNNSLDGATFKLYKIAKDTAAPTGNDAKDAAAKNAYYATKAIKDCGVVVSGTNNDVFTFKGLDDGTYVLCETVTPAGYNTIDPQVFDVVATHNPDGTALDGLSGNTTTGEITFTRDASDEDALKAVVQNKQGSTLPSTGGIGTTIIYILGAALVIGAGVMLVTRKKMNNDR